VWKWRHELDRENDTWVLLLLGGMLVDVDGRTRRLRVSITGAQMTRLQTCCSQMGQRVAGFDNSRESRLAWAGQVLGRKIGSFKELSGGDARKLIDTAQGEIGHRAPLAARTRRSAHEARRAGLDGRRGNTEFRDTPAIVSAQQISQIGDRYQRLGWTAAQFEAWLEGKSSPLRERKTIRTYAEGSKVLWALKGMLEAKGLWIDWSKG
jgi:hypothetical protein